MYEKKATFFPQQKNLIPGKQHIKKKQTNKRKYAEENFFIAKISLQTVRTTRFVIASATSTELFLGIDIYCIFYLLLSVHTQRTSKEKKLTVVIEPGSGRGQPMP